MSIQIQGTSVRRILVPIDGRSDVFQAGYSSLQQYCSSGALKDLKDFRGFCRDHRGLHQE